MSSRLPGDQAPGNCKKYQGEKRRGAAEILGALGKAMRVASDAIDRRFDQIGGFVVMSRKSGGVLDSRQICVLPPAYGHESIDAAIVDVIIL